MSIPTLDYDWKKPLLVKIEGPIGPGSGIVQVLELTEERPYYLHLAKEHRKLFHDNYPNDSYIGKVFKFSGETINGWFFPKIVEGEVSRPMLRINRMMQKKAAFQKKKGRA